MPPALHFIVQGDMHPIVQGDMHHLKTPTRLHLERYTGLTSTISGRLYRLDHMLVTTLQCKKGLQSMC